MPLYDDLDARNLEDHLERCRRDYESTGNPLYAWEAWGVWRAVRRVQRTPLPAWLGDYLDACGRRLHGWDPEPWQEGPNRHLLPWEEDRQMVATAMGFAGELDGARKAWGGQYDSNERDAQAVAERMWGHRESLEAAASYFGARSRATAHRRLKSAQRWALRWMAERVLEATGSRPALAETPDRFMAVCRKRSRAPR